MTDERHDAERTDRGERTQAAAARAAGPRVAPARGRVLADREPIPGDVDISRRRLLGTAGAAVAGGALASGVTGASSDGDPDLPDTGVAIVVLGLEPLARHEGYRPAHAQRLAEQRGRYRQWLAEQAPGAEVIYEYETVLNGLAIRRNQHGVETLRAGPGVRYVARSVPVHPTMGESLELIGAETSSELAGEGTKIAVLDTGIDQGHAFFDDDGLEVPDENWPRGNGDEWNFDVGEHTNGKVIAAYAYWDEEDPDVDPGDIHGHGTHVAGTAGGRAGTETDLGEAVSGVAPGAWLGNYNVFAGGTPTATENIVAAIEDAVEDGFDVINMSLGGSISEPEDPLMEAAENAIDDGVVVVSSAGNAGPGEETVTSPAAAPNVTAVGASSNAWGVFDSLFVYDGDVPDEDEPVAYLPGVNGGEIREPIEGPPLVAWELLEDHGSKTELACDGRGPPHDSPDLVAEFGEPPVVIVRRGECAFSEKAQNIKDAGGRAMIVYNNADADTELLTMTLENEVGLPSAFISHEDGQSIVDAIDHEDPPSVDITFDDVALDREANVLAEFSSRGPGPELEIKPEVVAPGDNIYSSVPGGGWATLSGTSMSSPHVAGSAALVLAEDGGAADPLAVRSALVNTADLSVDVGTGTVRGPMARGNGLVQVPDAIGTTVVAEPATVSFGRLASRGPDRRTTATRELVLRNLSDTTASLEVSLEAQSEPGPAVTVDLEGNGSVPAGESVTVVLTADASGQPNGDYWGQLRVADGGGTTALTVPLWYRVGR